MTSRDECYDAFMIMDDLFLAGKFEEAASILEGLDLEALSTSGIIAYMCAARWPEMHSDPFPIREPFLRKCWDVIRKREGDRTDNLLRGLEP